MRACVFIAVQISTIRDELQVSQNENKFIKTKSSDLASKDDQLSSDSVTRCRVRNCSHRLLLVDPH